MVCWIGEAVEKSFRGWVGSVLPSLAEGSVVAIDGKASRRSKMTGQQALHLVSAFATGARLVLGQEACAEKSNELTAIPVLLEALMLKGVIVTIDAMGTHSNIAQAIRDKEADYVLAVKDNQPKLAESITTFFEIGQAEGWKNTPHSLRRVGREGSWSAGSQALLGVHPTGLPGRAAAMARPEDVRRDRGGANDQWCNQSRTAALHRQHCP